MRSSAPTALGQLADEQTASLMTMHTLAGDPAAFAELAEREGLASYVNYCSGQGRTLIHRTPLEAAAIFSGCGLARDRKSVV